MIDLLASAPYPVGDDELVCLTLSHLKLPPDAFVTHLDTPQLDTNPPLYGFVRR
jgi:hypothetical protein